MNDRGSAPLELALGVGGLLLPVVLVLAVVPPLLGHRAVARTAAAEAARVLVVGDGSAASHESARAMAGRIAQDYTSVDVQLCGGECSLTRGGIVEVSVTVEAEPLVVPLVGELPGFPVTAVHREQVDAYRSFP